MFRKSGSLRVAVLAGGDSAERSVSLASGQSVARALTAAGHEVDSLDLRHSTAEHWREIDWRRFDVCFLALHGGAGEDGRLQQFLDEQHVRYTGPPANAARAAMSKSASKRRFLAAGVPTPEHRTFAADASLAEIARAAGALGYPLVVKPDAEGSSLGISLAAAPGELAAAVAECRRYGAVGLLETFVAGREFTVALVGQEPLPLLEICSPAPIFSYADKYEPGPRQHRFDTGLPQAAERAIVDAAVGAARALETRGLVRVDLRLDAGLRSWVLELNAIPGMTDTSLAPLAARQAGLEMPELCDLLLRQCLAAGPSR